MSLSEITTARPVAIAPTAAASVPSARWLTPVELTLLGAIWGGSFFFMRVAAADFGPFALVEVRLALGAVVLLPFLWRARSQFTPALWMHLAWISAINSAIPFLLFAWGRGTRAGRHRCHHEFHGGDVCRAHRVHLLR